MSGESSESKKADDKAAKKKEEVLEKNKKLKEEIEKLSGNITQKDTFVQEIRHFLKSEEIMMLVQ